MPNEDKLIPLDTLNDEILAKVLTKKCWSLWRAPEGEFTVLTSFGLSNPFPASTPFREAVLLCMDNEYQTNPEVELLKQDRTELLSRLRVAEQQVADIAANGTPRERILHHILHMLSYSATYWKNPAGRWFGAACGMEEPNTYISYEDVKEGDLVIGMMGEVGVLEAIVPDETWGKAYIIQPVGQERRVRWANESFKPIRGISETSLYIGAKYDFLVLLQQTRKDHEEISDWHIPYNVQIKGNQARMMIRQRYGGVFGAIPYEIVLENWQDLKTPEALFDAMSAQGWGARVFEREPSNKPEVKGPEGQA